MYEQYFGLLAKPFAITPDPRFLYLSERYHDALAHLIFGIREGDGFVQFTGEVGTGKTTLCRYLLERIEENVHIALILNPRLTVIELLQTICDEFSLAYPEAGTVKAYIDVLYGFLLERHALGERVVVILDEAQNLDAAVLEQLRLLTNLETKEQKLLQIILIGQPELRLLLDKPELRQLAQRITARYHLRALEKHEVSQYVQHRLLVAGAKRRLFSQAAIARIVDFSQSIPRLINILANRSLLIAYTKDRLQVTPAMVEQAARELYLPRPLRLGRWGLFSVLFMLVGVWVYVQFFPLPFLALTQTSQATVFSTENTENIEAAKNSAAAQIKAPEPASGTPVPQPLATFLPPANSDLVAANPFDGVAPARANSVVALEKAPLVLSLQQFFRGSPSEPPFVLLQALVRYWDQTPPLAADLDALCQALPASGLRCARFAPAAFNQDLLRQLNRPALLWVGESNTALLLLRLTTTANAQILAELGRQLPGDIALGRQFVLWSEIAALWKGEALLLWKPPLTFSGRLTSLRLGERGEAVLWLKASLEQAGFAVSDRQPIFDQNLKAVVQAFQRRHGLAADGIVGQKTLITLQNIIAPENEKRLIEE